MTRRRPAKHSLPGAVAPTVSGVIRFRRFRREIMDDVSFRGERTGRTDLGVEIKKPALPVSEAAQNKLV